MELTMQQIESNRFFFVVKKYCDDNKKKLKIIKQDLNRYEIQIQPDNLVFHFYQTIEGDEGISYPGLGFVQEELNDEKVLQIISTSLNLSKEELLKSFQSGNLPKGILGGQTTVRIIEPAIKA